MTTTKRKKVTKYRGNTTHGWGSMKKRRGAGHRGGRGAAGSGKRSDTKKPSVWSGKYFGKHGFKSKNSSVIISINVGQIDSQIAKFESKKLAAKAGDIFSIDLKKLGFDKLLGSGRVKGKYKITADFASKSAVEKIKKTGGEVILNTKSNE